VDLVRLPPQPTTMRPAIVVHRLTKWFPVRRPWREVVCRPLHPARVTVLDGIDLEVAPGEVFGLLGSNGAGKTTLLKILCTLLRPNEGRAAIQGFDVVEVPGRVRQVVGVCLETERSFYHRLTGRQNLAFFAALNNLDPALAANRIGKVLDTIGLNGAAGTPVMTYSGGMKQRLGLARALLTDPAVLLLDEPTKGLDPGAAIEFRRFLRETLAQDLGKTIVLVTHSLEEARECCDRVAILVRGRIYAQGTWPEVFDSTLAHGP
jgi:ABC-2 type transport system ATP-binding protein